MYDMNKENMCYAWICYTLKKFIRLHLYVWCTYIFMSEKIVFDIHYIYEYTYIRIYVKVFDTLSNRSGTKSPPLLQSLLLYYVWIKITTYVSSVNICCCYHQPTQCGCVGPIQVYFLGGKLADDTPSMTLDLKCARDCTGSPRTIHNSAAWRYK